MSDAHLQLRLVQIRLEAEDIASYVFEAADDRPLPPFTAGAHIDLHLPDAMVRSYSLVNAPSDRRHYTIAVRREADGKGGSAWMHDVPRVGDSLPSNAPVNDFALDETATESIFIAGGIGITPILSMIRRLDAIGRRWRLHYAARSPEAAAFAGELRALERSPGDVEFCFSSSHEKRIDLEAIAAAAAPGTHLYCCGPAAMIDAFLLATAQHPAGTIHVERFAAAAEAATNGGFDVVLARGDQRFEVLPGKTILDTLLDHGVDVPYSCMAGVCGSCMTGVCKGIPDHRDDYLTAEEKRAGKSIMICCSGSRSKELVLDL